MSGPGALSTWNAPEGIFSLNDEFPKPRPRAWERAPRSPVLARHHGRKVWKRYEAPPKPEAKAGSRDVEQTRQALGDATNTTLRPVKRLRLKDAPKVESKGKENKAAQYFATLRDQENAGTPKRKHASRKSLKPDNKRMMTRSADAKALKVFDRPMDSVPKKSLHAGGSPALEHVRELSGANDNATEAAETAATDTLEHSNGFTKDEISLESENATLCEENASTDQSTSIVEASPHSKAITWPVMIAFADENIRTDSHNTSTEAIPEGADTTLMNSTATSALEPIVGAPSSQDETFDAKGAKSVVVTPSTTHPSSIPESLQLKSSVRVSPEKELALEQPNSDSLLRPSASAKTPRRTSPRKKPNLLSPQAVMSPGRIRTPKSLTTAKSLRVDYPGETPQIGTSLLRRESLRAKESPCKKKDGRKSNTPKKRDTLQRRDTLQEREILQRVIAETNANNDDENLDDRPIETSTLPYSSATPETEDSMGNHAHGNPEPIFHEELTDVGTTDRKAASPAIDETVVEKDLHRAMEAIDVYEKTGATDASQLMLDDVAPGESQEIEAIDKANEVLAKTELEDVSQAMEATGEHALNHKTRSRTRFSDDTSMLKDFLNRAQARKAARTTFLSAPDAPIPGHSPRRSPRKTHGPQAGYAPSPQKLQNIVDRPGSPPGTPKTEALDSDDGECLAGEAASCRRSTRARLPAPSKAPPGAPSFIPVRRADGTDPVVLQKSQAQELAVTTRANTRRNKGQSKPPLLALQALPPESADVASTAKQRAERAKSVAWAERIASYQDAKDDADDAGDRRPKVRRLRGLGAVNGTPAAKRTTGVLGTSNGTPAPKRRGKV